ncbi:MAG TPA: hemerythrin domain-containing protein [Mesorhizobium sp.]|jgi:hypothetical protein|nr:hemerythrin domain-containing protein [Mesorhizobium sp.]
MLDKKAGGEAGCPVSDDCPVSSVCAPTRRPCADMTRAHQETLDLCRSLEAIADGLPRLDRLQCLRAANRLVPLLKASHAYEEEVVFPAFEAARPPAAAVGRLKTEHLEDECAAEELTEVLFRLGHGGRLENPEALGFMLRAFFNALRRHIAFERHHILPALPAAAPA